MLKYIKLCELSQTELKHWKCLEMEKSNFFIYNHSEAEINMIQKLANSINPTPLLSQYFYLTQQLMSSKIANVNIA